MKNVFTHFIFQGPQRLLTKITGVNLFLLRHTLPPNRKIIQTNPSPPYAPPEHNKFDQSKHSVLHYPAPRYQERHRLRLDERNFFFDLNFILIKVVALVRDLKSSVLEWRESEKSNVLESTWKPGVHWWSCLQSSPSFLRSTHHTISYLCHKLCYHSKT